MPFEPISVKFFRSSSIRDC